MTAIRIATRQSALALWQANYVKEQLQIHHPDLTIEIVPMTTQGDTILDTSLSKIGGKGLFIKELEHALLENRADIAVHSMKDVPSQLPNELTLAAICIRDDPRDAFVSNLYSSLDTLPTASIVGTSSLRRQSQLKALRPDLNIKVLRGNVNTRLAKLDRGEYDSIILAAAGLKRLQMQERITAYFPPSDILPAVGQGAIGIECRLNDSKTQTLLTPLNDPQTEVCVMAERAMNVILEGGCQVPIGGFALLEHDKLWLRGFVGSEDGSLALYSEVRGLSHEAIQLGHQVAKSLLDKGAIALLQVLNSAKE